MKMNELRVKQLEMKSQAFGAWEGISREEMTKDAALGALAEIVNRSNAARGIPQRLADDRFLRICELEGAVKRIRRNSRGLFFVGMIAGLAIAVMIFNLVGVSV